MMTSVTQLARPDTSLGKNSEARLVVQSSMGSFEILLHAKAAPETCQYFVNLVMNGGFQDACVFRIVTDEQKVALDDDSIHVVQVGMRDGYEARRTLIHHEDTRATGLGHRRYTVSAARYGAGEVYGSFFVCMRDEPALDFGGSRQPDGQGFAAFGEVVEGQDVVEKINECAEQSDLLSKKVAIHNISLQQ